MTDKPKSDGAEALGKGVLIACLSAGVGLFAALAIAGHRDYSERQATCERRGGVYVNVDIQQPYQGPLCLRREALLMPEAANSKPGKGTK